MTFVFVCILLRVVPTFLKNRSPPFHTMIDPTYLKQISQAIEKNTGAIQDVASELKALRVMLNEQSVENRMELSSISSALRDIATITNGIETNTRD